MKLRVLAGLLVGLLTSSVVAQETPVVLGKHKVHPTRILARYADAAAPQAAEATVQSLGLQVREQFSLVPGLVVLDVNDSLRPAAVAVDPDQQARVLLERIAALQNSGQFRYVEPSYIDHILLVPSDAAFQDGRLWGLRNRGQNGGKAGVDVGAERAWDLTTGSTNVIVAVVDTGTRYRHQDLATNMWVNPNEIAGNGKDDDNNGFVDDVHGINAIENTGNPLDDNDHGTHVSGTIGAVANNGAPHVGVAWQVRLMALKAFDASGRGETRAEIACIDYAVKNGAKIINASWGGYGRSQALYDSISAARGAGVLFVAAAGNESNNNDLVPAYPASFDLDNIVSVAAIDRSDRLAYFSNYGADTVDIGAPGVSIFSSIAVSDSSYGIMSGTSMASPHVAGVAALLWANFPTATLAEVRERLLATAIRTPALIGRCKTGGRVNAYEALKATPDGVLELSITPPNGAILVQQTTEPIFARVTDIFAVLDATVVGTYSTGDEVFTIDFKDDGQAPDVEAGDGTYSANLDIPAGVTSITLTVTATMTGYAPVTQRVTYTCVRYPSNDNFADANKAKVPPGGGSFMSDNRFATIELGEPLHAGVPTVAASLWWVWSPSVSGPVVVDTAGSVFDTVLAVYTGNRVDSLTEIAAVDDVVIPRENGPPTTRLQGNLSFDAEAFKTYYIAVAGYDSKQKGTLRLRVEPNGGPDYTPPVVAVGSPKSGYVATGPQLTVTGTAFDPQPNASGISEVMLKVNNQALATTASGTAQWSAPVVLVRGLNTIEVSARDFSGNLAASQTVQVDYRVADPVNDVFANATPLPGIGGTVTNNNEKATRELGEPVHAGNEGGHSVWYTWTAPADGFLRVTTADSSFDTLLAVYTGSTVTNLTEMASNDDASAEVQTSEVGFGVRAGQTYAIAVDGYGAAAGDITLLYVWFISDLFHVELSSTAGGSVDTPSGDYRAGSTLNPKAVPEKNYEFVRWEGSFTSEANPLPLTVASNVTLTAVFRVVSFADDFETGNFSKQPWTFGGAQPWVVQTNLVAMGKYAARSGRIGHGQTSALKLTTPTAAGTGSFELRVSSESRWDWLEFYINGALNGRWSGDIDWRLQEFQLSAGTNTLEWRYVKDATFSVGLDAAFIDNVWLPFEESTLNLARADAETFTVELQGQSGQVYVVEASTDLKNWQAIATETAVDGVIRVTDRPAGGLARFYRAKRL
jgi:subtilisin family serine protease